MSRSSRITPATPSLGASQQSHIEDLVKRNEFLQSSNLKLQNSLQAEKTRAKDALAQVQSRWQDERARLASNFDDAQTTHRLVEYRTADMLQMERIALLAEQDATRRERVARLQRDARILAFQISESELQAKLEDMEDERELLLQKHKKALEKLKSQNAEMIARVNELTAERAEDEGEREQLEVHH
jgi:hypothetical protein